MLYGNNPGQCVRTEAAERVADDAAYAIAQYAIRKPAALSAIKMLIESQSLTYHLALKQLEFVMQPFDRLSYASGDLRFDPRAARNTPAGLAAYLMTFSPDDVSDTDYLDELCDDMAASARSAAEDLL
jgi:hypothetical protein